MPDLCRAAAPDTSRLHHGHCRVLRVRLQDHRLPAFPVDEVDEAFKLYGTEKIETAACAESRMVGKYQGVLENFRLPSNMLAASHLRYARSASSSDLQKQAFYLFYTLL